MLRHILYIIFAILIAGIGSSVNAFAPTDSVEGKRVLLVSESENRTDHRKESVEIKDKKFSENEREKNPDSKDIREQRISNGSILILTFLAFAAFFIILNFDEIRRKMTLLR